MPAEAIFSLVVGVICMLPVLIIGIVQYKSREPVGFWAGKEPPGKDQITDVKAYNHKHGLMWMLYGAGFILCFGCGMFLSSLLAVILAGIECIGGIFLMILYHNRLDRTYLKKGDDT